MLEKEIVILNAKKISDQSEALEMLANKLLNEDTVKESYLSAIMEREKEYPTGLLMESGIGIAIPHTDAEHVLINQLAVMTLNSPVNFKQMGDDSTTVPVNIIFMLALKESESQLDTLQKLMAIGQEKETLKSLLDSNNESEALVTLNNSFEN